MTTDSRPILLSDYAQPRRRLLIDETTKTIFDGPEPGTYVLYFKDNLVYEDEQETVNGKGILNNRISELLMTRLNELNIDTHFVRSLNMREQLVKATETLPFYLTIHNVACSQFAKRLGLEDGMILSKPIPEFSIRSKQLGNPVVAAEHLTSLGWCRFEEIDELLLTSQRINDFLCGQFLALNMRLMSFTLQFGRHYPLDMMDSQIVIIDEISPDTFHALDLHTGRRLDQQGVEDDLENASEIYQEVARRFGLLGLDNLDGNMASTPQNIFSTMNSPNRRPFKQRKNPHGHNSL
jgi:phosphoribosylaminoimidazole-succinocarboxamide synthase